MDGLNDELHIEEMNVKEFYLLLCSIALTTI